MQKPVIDLITLSMLISATKFGFVFCGLDSSRSDCCFIASKIFNRTGHGLRRDCLLGIVGAIVGGFLSNVLGKASGSGVDLYSAVVAVVGAVVFIFVYHALFRRRRFLSMRSLRR